jgi:hypothetical protein
MSDRLQHEQWETSVRERAHALPYPPTPNIAGAVRRRLEAQHPRITLFSRQWARLALIVLVILAGLLAVPQVRASVARVFQIGVIRIFLAEPTLEIAETPSSTTATAATDPTLPSSPTPIASLLDLAGETPLDDARAQVDFAIRLPAYPTDLGPPERVFVQNLDGTALILVWLDPQRPEGVRLSLHMLTAPTMVEKSFASKGGLMILEETTVNGQRALWVRGEHYFQLSRAGGAEYALRRLVEGDVLIWTAGDLTYRLESDLTLEEAVQVAESLR